MLSNRPLCDCNQSFFGFAIGTLTSPRAPPGALSWVGFSATTGLGVTVLSEEHLRLKLCPGTWDGSPVNSDSLTAFWCRGLGLSLQKASVFVSPDRKGVTAPWFKGQWARCSFTEVSRSEPVNFHLSRYMWLKGLIYYFFNALVTW